MNIRGICFDMDGILTNTENIGSEMLMRAVELQGLHVSDEQWHTMIGSSWQRTCELITEYCGPQFDSDRFITDWKRLTLDWMREHGVPLMPYAREALQRLKSQGYSIALCTSNARDVVEAYLFIADLQQYFDAIVTADDIPHAKPAPDVYLRGAAAIGLKPEVCMGVEDSYNGVRAVRRAGMHCVMIPDQLPYLPSLRFDTDLVLNNLEELVQLLTIQ